MIDRVQERNTAMLGRWLRRYHQEKEELLVKVTRSKDEAVENDFITRLDRASHRSPWKGISATYQRLTYQIGDW